MKIKKYFINVVLVVVFIVILIFCFITGESSDSKNVANKTDSNSTNQNDSVTDETEVDTEDESITTPDKSTWEAMRDIALSGMSEKDIENLTNIIKKRNEYLEQCITYNSYELKLSNPNALLWNEFTSTGEIQIGWAYDTEIWNNRASYDMSDEEFNKQYGQPVMEDNEYDGNAFISEMSELKNTIQNEDLKEDINHMIELMQSAMQNHTVDDILEIHKILHDMDYFLLRYGPELYIGYVRDRSSLNEYYGSLNVYHNNI